MTMSPKVNEPKVFDTRRCSTFHMFFGTEMVKYITHTWCSLSHYIRWQPVPQGVLLWQVFFGYYDAVFFIMGRWSGSQRRRSSIPRWTRIDD